VRDVDWSDYRAVLFDLDGVVTPTAEVHMRAWSAMFNAYLTERADRLGGEPPPPYTDQDYYDFVDGKPRYDGVRSFLASRGIELPEGGPDDPPDAETVHGLGNRKNALVQKLIRERGVTVFDGSRRFVDAAREAGLHTAVVSSSANTREILDAAGIADRFETVVDGHDVADRGLKGKPAPDTFLAAAKQLGVEPPDAAVFEDALAGVEAGRAGHFGQVIGVDRVGQADALREHGADVVVRDLAELLEDA
jgi:beta-phosphoglucomutase family hydrolase